MKKHIFIFLILLEIISCQALYSQDTNIVKYLPLKVGNVWVYYGNYGSPLNHSTWFDNYKLTTISVINGKSYYAIQHIRNFITGSYPGSARLYYQDSPLRVDTNTGNIYLSIGCGTLNVFLVDSLISKKGDTAVVCGNFQGNKSVCNDTSMVNIFNIERPSKNFYLQGFEGNNDQKFVKNIGLVQYFYHQSMEGFQMDLRGCIIDGILYGDTTFPVGVTQISSEVPLSFSLSQNYPNPFNPNTVIRFQITNSSDTKLIIYDALGKEVETLVDRKLEPGEYEAEFNGENLPSGVYYYKLQAGDYAETKKMVLIK